MSLEQENKAPETPSNPLADLHIDGMVTYDIQAREHVIPCSCGLEFRSPDSGDDALNEQLDHVDEVWQYGDDLMMVRSAAQRLGLIDPREPPKPEVIDKMLQVHVNSARALAARFGITLA